MLQLLTGPLEKFNADQLLSSLFNGEVQRPLERNGDKGQGTEGTADLASSEVESHSFRPPNEALSQNKVVQKMDKRLKHERCQEEMQKLTSFKDNNCYSVYGPEDWITSF